jgi:putative Mg2+ transporter-C (MgtC) family protein
MVPSIEEANVLFGRTMTLPDSQLVVRLLVAAALGSMIGAERERLVWAAGLRTHMLVCVGACLIMIVSAYGFGAVLGKYVVLDPSRVAAQVVSGIGFLGAGSILLRGDVVRGLTTAASLWTVAAIGLAVGGGLYIEAVAATIIILVILAGIKPLEQRYQRRYQTHEIRVRCEHGQLSFDTLHETLGYRASRITRYVASPTDDPALDEVALSVSRLSEREISEIVHQLEALPCVHEIVKSPL